MTLFSYRPSTTTPKQNLDLRLGEECILNAFLWKCIHLGFPLGRWDWFNNHEKASTLGLFPKPEKSMKTLCQSNVAFSWRTAPQCLRNVSLLSVKHCKKVMLHYNSFRNIYCFQWILHRLRELSYWSSSVPFQVTFLQKGLCQSHRGSICKLFV